MELSSRLGAQGEDRSQVLWEDRERVFCRGWRATVREQCGRSVRRPLPARIFHCLPARAVRGAFSRQQRQSMVIHAPGACLSEPRRLVASRNCRDTRQRVQIEQLRAGED
jgi:hypothetical protein